jgi:lipoprotein-anchoring transpeptidase ErfK/SrfK
MGRRRRGARLTAVAVAVAILCGCSSKSTSGGLPASAERQATTVSVPQAAPSSSVPNLAAAIASGSSLVAQALGAQVPVHVAMSATAPVATTLGNPNEDGAPLVFLVEQSLPGWLLVYLPVRPNGSQGWIQSSMVRVTIDPYRLVVDRGAHQLTLYQNDQVALHVPVGIGTTSTPTPGGIFYIKELLRPPTPNGPYGPYAFGLSGFSDVLKSFADGNGVIGLHGTNEPQYVGKDVSHGCIRLYNADILKLVQVLPLGTPVEIAA